MTCLLTNHAVFLELDFINNLKILHRYLYKYDDIDDIVLHILCCAYCVVNSIKLSHYWAS